MRTIAAPATSVPGREARENVVVRLLAVAIGLSTALTILGASLLILLLPLYLHPALDYAGSAEILGLPSAQVHHLSDRTVSEVLFGPGTFAFPAPDGSVPFYDRSEASHLQDVRVVLWAFLVAVLVSVLALALAVAWAGREAWVWRAMSRGGATLAAVLAVVGLIGLVAFEPLFVLFHRIFFPGGNWAFDPRAQRLVQLYPTAFWQLTASALAALAITAGIAAWWWGRRGADRLQTLGEGGPA